MRKPKIAPTAERRRKKDFGIALADLHSQLWQVAGVYEILHTQISSTELRKGKPARWAFSQLNSLRKAIPPNAQLRDVSVYYRKFATGWPGYYRKVAVQHEDGDWIHGFIDAHEFLDAIECGLNLALSGDADFTRPLRELNRRFPYRPEQYRKGKRRAESAY